MTEVIKPSKPLQDTKALRRQLERAMSDTVQDGVTFMREYPPQTLTKTGYVRTGTLMHSWSGDVKSGGNRIEGIIGSSARTAPYNKYVQGTPEDQTHLMAGAGWQNTEILMNAVRPKLMARVNAAFRGLK